MHLCTLCMHPMLPLVFMSNVINMARRWTASMPLLQYLSIASITCAGVSSQHSVRKFDSLQG